MLHDALRMEMMLDFWDIHPFMALASAHGMDRLAEMAHLKANRVLRIVRVARKGSARLRNFVWRALGPDSRGIQRWDQPGNQGKEAVRAESSLRLVREVQHGQEKKAGVSGPG